MIQDLRHTVRRMRARPSVAILPSVLLGLAIGLTAATFALVDALILRPVPFPDAESLKQVGLGRSEQDYSVNLPLGLIQQWRESAGFGAVHAVTQTRATFGTGEDQVGVSGARVTQGMFEELGAAPLLGRTFVPGDGVQGRDDLAVVAESLWRTRFGGDPLIVGQRVEMNGAQVLIAGVMPDSFAFPFAQTRVWRPLDLAQPGPAPGRGAPSAYAYVRLAQDRPLADAARIATEVAHRRDPATADRKVILRGVGEGLLDAYSSGTIRAGAAAVVLVFLVLCANVLNLTLAGLAERRREFALCSVLGASRARLLRQAVYEQLLIGGAAALIGIGIGSGLVAAARAWLPASILTRTLNPLDFDVRSVIALALLSIVAVVVAGVWPAWLGTRHDPAAELQLMSKGASADRRSRRLTTGLLVAELAVAVALCVAAGIQLRSFVNLLQDDRGLDAEALTVFEMQLPGAAVIEGATRLATFEHLRATAAAIPGVDGATLSFGVPPRAGSLYRYDVTAGEAGIVSPRLEMNSYSVMPEFFRTYGIRVVQGRGLVVGDAPNSVVISLALANKLWPGQSAVGRTMLFSDGRAFDVVGVSGEIRNPRRDPRSDEPEIYESLAAPAGPSSVASSRSVHLTIRCTTGCPPLETIRAQLRSASSGVLVYAGIPVSNEYLAALERPRAGAVVAVTFAVIGLIAVGTGLFAVLSRVAWQRRREFGVRLALGATPHDVRRLVRTTGLRLAAAGLAGGAVLAIGLGRMLAAVQYEVTLTDPAIWLTVVIVITATVFASTLRPSREAGRVDPLTLLRAE